MNINQIPINHQYRISIMNVKVVWEYLLYHLCNRNHNSIIWYVVIPIPIYLFSHWSISLSYHSYTQIIQWCYDQSSILFSIMISLLFIFINTLIIHYIQLLEYSSLWSIHYTNIYLTNIHSIICTWFWILLSIPIRVFNKY